MQARESVSPQLRQPQVLASGHPRPAAASLRQRATNTAWLSLFAGLSLAGCGAAAAPSNAEPATPTKHAAASISDPSFELRFSAEPVQVGAPALAEIELQSKAPFKCNDKYPYKFEPALEHGVSYASEVMRVADSISHERVTMSVPFTANAAGPHTLRGTFSFSVCTDDQCRIEKRDLSLQIQAH